MRVHTRGTLFDDDSSFPEHTTRLAEDLEQRRLTIQRGLVRDSQLLEAKVAGMRETKAFIEKTLGAIIKRRILVTGDLLSASAKA